MIRPRPGAPATSTQVAISHPHPTCGPERLTGDADALPQIGKQALSERGVEGVTLRSHPETIASVKKQGLSETNSLTLLSDPGMPPGEAVATWSGGGLGFDPAALFEQVAGILCPDSQHKEAIRA